MSGKLLLFGGTTEGREIAEYGLPAIYCVATAYGGQMLKAAGNVEIRVGRLDAAQIAALIREQGIACVIDATHPYALEVTSNIRNACADTGAPLRRVRRAGSACAGEITVASCAEAVSALNRFSGKALVTTGSKDLPLFKQVENFSARLFVRVLPCVEAIAQAEALGFKKENIIAAQGPFSVEENVETLRRIGAEIIVTKDGGAQGGFPEKMMAARQLGVKAIVIARPAESGCSVKQAVFWARRKLGVPRPPLFPLNIDIEGEQTVIVGGGAVALRRARTLRQCGARVRVISPETAGFVGFEGSCCEIIDRPYRSGDLDGAILAVAATNDAEVNRLVGAEASEKGIWVNLADSAEDCDFYFPSIIEEGGITISVSAAGMSPALVRSVSDKLRKMLPDFVAEARSEYTLSKKGAVTQ